jgi:hypothetical protein
MPDLDYVVLADYVRQDGGTVHIMAAGLDTFSIPVTALPASVPVGVATRIMFSSRDQVGETHSFSLEFSGPGGVLLTVSQRFQRPPPVAGVPEHWRTALQIAVRLGLPFPAHGDYALQVMLDDDPRLSRRLDLRVIEPVSL